MSFFIPARLQETASGRGAEGTRWLQALPLRVAELERAWSLTAGRAFASDGYIAWVAPVRLEDGSEAVLKIGIPFPDTRHEADALRFYEGHGAARLLRVSEDGFSLLLERCLPGASLWSLDEDARSAVGAGLLRRLWRSPSLGDLFRRLTDLVARWAEVLPREAPVWGYDAGMVAGALRIARDLAGSQPRTLLLHGDFHPGNVLSAAREPWLAIDPQPVIGDPAFDLAQWLGDLCEPAEQSADPIAAIRRHTDRMSRLLDLDPTRVAGWAFAKSVGEDFGPSQARLLRAAMP